MAKFVIEHLEPRMYKWSVLEYAHISSFVGKKNLLFTNTKSDVLKKFGRVEPRSVKKLNLRNACILDPEAKQTLTPQSAKKFDYFIFGGILGDDPPRERTKEILTEKLKFPAFNLGKDQMSTDTAVIVTKMIVSGKKLSDLKFQEGITIKIDAGAEVILPYKYLLKNNKPLIAPGIVDMLRKQKTF